MNGVYRSQMKCNVISSRKREKKNSNVNSIKFFIFVLNTHVEIDSIEVKCRLAKYIHFT